MKNLNLLFNKTYYSSLKMDGNKAHVDFISAIDKCNEELWTATFDEKKDYSESKVDGVTPLRMETSYPGVLVGTGYAHGSGIDGADADINCGFSFDYVTGQPYIPGSSVKGLLRSAFRHEEIIRSIFPERDFSIKSLEKELFGTAAGEIEGDDVFLDAVIYRGDKNKKVVGKDYITPHSSPIKNPIPIHIIKIMPGVIIEFRFVLKDTTTVGNTVFDTTDKLKLYTEILQLLGIGAKTNVGYGTLSLYETKT